MLKVYGRCLKQNYYPNPFSNGLVCQSIKLKQVSSQSSPSYSIIVTELS